MKDLENDVKQLEEEVSSLVDQVIALKAELESHESLIVKKEKTIAEIQELRWAQDQTIAELHAWSKRLEEDNVKKDETIADLHGVLVATK
jgi:septal ring factor EnvC (AmiA/AmiB activator)